ncbi:hypothetical protein [Mannheimia pernigra]|uniref:Uncharacterized protein n=1 Tax=Mannheimia pernigra TaxID=111844 RepID=A0A7D5IEX6_9PAST|nr:hypothetical protein [Mannheimia pernigra]QLB41175.1 hypothetical protein HV559_10035 [Mannheimia pernigra]
MNNIKTYLNNLTKTDIENATQEQLALIIDYMEQVKGDVDFSALIKEKVEQFKQFATEANNKIILEAALQEQQEKQEILRERVRFMRNLDYIEKTVQVQNTREEDSRIQRNIERQQYNIQAQVATIMALYQSKLIELEAFTKTETYRNVLKTLENFKNTNPEMVHQVNLTQDIMKKAFDPEAMKKTMIEMANNGESVENMKTVSEKRIEFTEVLKENYIKNENNPQELIKGTYLAVADLLKNIPEGTEKYVRDFSDEVQRMIEKHYGKKYSKELLERFEKDLKSGVLKIEEFSKLTEYLQGFSDLANLNAIKEEKNFIKIK